MAIDRGIQVLALTDHETTSGIREAQVAAQGSPLAVVPGVEIGADYEVECHILGYYVDLGSTELSEALTRLRNGRLVRAREMLERLSRLGFSLRWERVTELAGKKSAVGRPHVAQAMVEKGYVSSVEEAFSDYIGRDKPGYVARPKLTPAETIRLIRNAGGVPVLAHPARLGAVIPSLVAEGLGGLETYYTGYTQNETEALLALADAYGLVVTGGSDFHGVEVLPDFGLGAVEVPWKILKPLRRAAGRKESPKGV
jgi:hypothetical protein